GPARTNSTASRCDTRVQRVGGEMARQKNDFVQQSRGALLRSATGCQTLRIRRSANGDPTSYTFDQSLCR
ncbi:unnamed protein product, partial [Mycena citricolor]